MKINVSYAYSSFNTLYKTFHPGFHLSLTWFNATYWADSSLPFAVDEGVILYLKWSEENISPMNKNAYDSKHNTQVLFFSCKHTT